MLVILFVSLGTWLYMASQADRPVTVSSRSSPKEISFDMDESEPVEEADLSVVDEAAFRKRCATETEGVVPMLTPGDDSSRREDSA